MNDEEKELSSDYAYEDGEDDSVSGDRSFKIDRSVKAWYLIKRRRKRKQEEKQEEEQ